MTRVVDAPTDTATAAVPARATTTPIIVNLLPPEIVAKHRAREWRRRVVLAVAVVLLVVCSIDAIALRQTELVRAETASEQSALQTLRLQESKFAANQRTKAAAAALAATLTGLMTADLPWWQLLPAVSAAAPAGTAITSVNGTLTGAGTTATPGVTPPLGDPTAIGTLKIVGAAPSKDEIATFADTLATVPGLANPYVTAVTAGDASSYAFTVQVEILPLARGGRYTPATGR